MVLASLVDLGASLDRVRDAWARAGLERVTVDPVQVDPAGLRALMLDVRVDGKLADSAVPEGTSKVATPLPSTDGRHPDGSSGPMTGGADHHHEHAPGAHHHHERAVAHAHHPHPTGPHESGHHHHGHRPYREIRKMLDTIGLPPPVVALAQDAFRRLAEAEAKAHGIDPEQVIFHEVGADDAIADILGVAVALHELDIRRVTVSPFPLGRGLTRGGHGPIPLPAPATLHLIEGAPTVGTPLVGETVTPTGAALLMAMADGFGPSPAMVVRATGCGAGHKRWPDRPNIVRAILGEAVGTDGRSDEADVVIEANIDDMRPEDLTPLLDALFKAGAADAWAQPLYMKKGRPGLKVSALLRQSLQPAVVQTFFIHSPTLGVRVAEVRRFRAERRMTTVDTEFGAVRVKLAPRPDGSVLAAPEHDDCLAKAAAAGVSPRRVYEAALKGVWNSE